mmetsp:Transcript_23298/g.67990  ORF Transcript_23298/g.67990 Transcript_23298/m.67990 type:complete len:219 (-) Transcript_23298:2156-2812(-)
MVCIGQEMGVQGRRLEAAREQGCGVQYRAVHHSSRVDISCQVRHLDGRCKSIGLIRRVAMTPSPRVDCNVVLVGLEELLVEVRIELHSEGIVDPCVSEPRSTGPERQGRLGLDHKGQAVAAPGAAVRVCVIHEVAAEGALGDAKGEDRVEALPDVEHPCVPRRPCLPSLAARQPQPWAAGSRRRGGPQVHLLVAQDLLRRALGRLFPVRGEGEVVVRV